MAEFMPLLKARELGGEVEEQEAGGQQCWVSENDKQSSMEKLWPCYPPVILHALILEQSSLPAYCGAPGPRTQKPAAGGS